MSFHPRIAVLGLGYVGLPLAIALARKFHVIGLDIDQARVEELERDFDRTGEIEAAVLRATTLATTSDAREIRGSDVYLVTVPTPVDDRKLPDLGLVRSACRTIGGVMAKGAIVVFESTVYPGVTESICGPELENASGLVCGRDFFLGYSPERINPGDREHTIERIPKVVAGQTPEVAETLKKLYGAVTSGGVFVARDIRTAEAAKVIENAQRDINIAFINEVAMIFQRLGLSVHDVLEASRTKWNFLDFRPGLVGGHCIGVDPFYLAHCAMQSGHHPEIILAGRRINDDMGGYLALRIHESLRGLGMGTARVLVLGLTFKENVPDLRNSRVVDMVAGLRAQGHEVDVHDPLADAGEARKVYGLDLVTSLDGLQGYDGIVGAVAHRSYVGFTLETFATLLRPGGLVADIKGMWRPAELPPGTRYWSL